MRLHSLVQAPVRAATWSVRRDHEDLLTAIGALHSRTVRESIYESIQDAEFKIFSQFGEDGIIQYLIGRIPIANKTFIELGVGDYKEANTRFLLLNNKWQGLIVDSGLDHVETARRWMWTRSLKAKSIFVTRDNVNDIIAQNGIRGDIGILSIDIDGMDYWILEEIHGISPRIIIAEYNSTFGADAMVTVPYDANFDVWNGHYSGLYFGASLAAMCKLAASKGYTLVGSESSGVNAFFVRNDVLGNLPALSARQGYAKSNFRAFKSKDGGVLYVDNHQDRLKIIGHLPIYDLESDRVVKINDVLS